MRATFSFFVICLLIGSAVAQKQHYSFPTTVHHKGQPSVAVHQKGETIPIHNKGEFLPITHHKGEIVAATHHKGEIIPLHHKTEPVPVHHKGEIIPAHQKGFPVTRPQPINESDRKKQCPAGFQFVGKQCAKTLTAPAEVTCPHGTIFTDNKCAKYVGKFSECPAGFHASKGTCVKSVTAEPEVICPDGFVLGGKDSCVRKIQLPKERLCPVGSIARGDDCITATFGPPQLTCPEGYELHGRVCQREETYDCTPVRPTELPHKGKDFVETHKSYPAFRREAPSKGKEVTRYTLHEEAPVVEEYVIRETCKRITREPARRICTHGGILDGKLCRVEARVDYIYKNGGFKDEFIPAVHRCPLGFVKESKGICQAAEEVLPTLHCPANTIDVGNRCAIFSRPQSVCPPGFAYEGKGCVKTIFAAPVVEFSVTYKCTGKNCADSF